MHQKPKFNAKQYQTGSLNLTSKIFTRFTELFHRLQASRNTKNVYEPIQKKLPNSVIRQK